MLEGLRTDEEKVAMVVTLLAYGCPHQAIVHAFGLDERTVAAWQKRAGKHCQRVHAAMVEQGKVESQHIQADEIRAKGRKLIIWIALAMDVPTRLWLAGVVSQHRDRRLIDRLFQHVRACCQFMHALLVCTDGFAAYPKSIVRTFREKVKKQAGRGRCCLEVWHDLCIATVIKHTKKKRVVEITRKCRHAAARMETLEEGMYLIRCSYNFCFPHHELSKTAHFGCPTTPAMAASLTDHIWSMRELLMYKIAPSPFLARKQAKRSRKSLVSDPTVPKRPRGRPRTRPVPDPSLPKRPRGRPRKIALATSTV
jgi:hypothetical protein